MGQAAEEREEEERAEAERLEAEWLEARRTEAARQEAASVIVDSGPASSSDSQITSVEKALEKVQEEQEAIKQKLDKQEASSANMQNLLAQNLGKLSGPSP